MTWLSLTAFFLCAVLGRLDTRCRRVSAACANPVAFVVVGKEIQISVSMGGFAIHINNDGIVLTGNQSVQKSDLIVGFFFSGEGDVWVDGVESITKGVDFSF